MGDVRLIGFFGNLGCYKTSFAVVVARMLAEMHGIGIVGNLGLKVPNSKRVDVSDLVGNEYVDTVLLLDEIYTLADSRMSLSSQNVFFSYAIAQARKSPHVSGGKGIGNFVVYTAQLQSMADLRLFELTNLYVLMEKLPNGNAYFESVTDDGVEGGGEVPISFFEREAFPYFDTDEKVMPLSIESLRVEMEQYNPVKYNARIDGVVGQILEKYTFKDWKDVKRFTVNDFLRREGLPVKLAVPVYDRVCEMVRIQK